MQPIRSFALYVVLKNTPFTIRHGGISIIAKYRGISHNIFWQKFGGKLNK